MSMSIFYFLIYIFFSLCHYVIKSSYKKGIEKKTLSKPASSSYFFQE